MPFPALYSTVCSENSHVKVNEIFRIFKADIGLLIKNIAGFTAKSEEAYSI